MLFRHGSISKIVLNDHLSNHFHEYVYYYLVWLPLVRVDISDIPFIHKLLTSLWPLCGVIGLANS